jgi:hypothetical protein
MSSWWPWLLIAASGALHGLNPLGGFGLAMLAGLRSHERWTALRALGPIALGHLASLALVAGGAMLGVSMGHGQWAALAAAAWLTLVGWHCVRERHRTGRLGVLPKGRTGLGLGAFALSSLHGAGLALVPTLLPLCASPPAAQAGGVTSSVLQGAAALAVHTAAMLVVSGAVAALVCGTVTRRLPQRWLRNSCSSQSANNRASGSASGAMP